MLNKEEIEKILLWLRTDGTIFTTDVEKIENYIQQLENQLKYEKQDYMQTIYALRSKNIELDRKIDQLEQENKALKKGITSLMASRKKWKDRYYKLRGMFNKQNKIIDEMSEQLAGLTIWDNEKEEPLILMDKEEVKQYFEKKVEEK